MHSKLLNSNGECIIKDTKYQDILKTINDRTISSLVVSGSIAYGTDIATSDVDIRGVAHQKTSEILGLDAFNNITILNKETDVDLSICGMKEFFKKLMSCNPNTIEILCVDDDDIIFADDTFNLLRDNVNLFLTKDKVCHSFGGFATQQLRRLQNANAHDNYDEQQKLIHIKQSMERSIVNMNCKIKGDFPDSSINIVDNEIVINGTMQNVPLKNFKSYFNEISNVLKCYNKLNSRNQKKDDLHLNKHATHLVRLILMQKYAFEDGIIKVKFDGEDLKLLMSIRNGNFMTKNHTMTKEFYSMIDDMEIKNNILYNNSLLSNKQDIKKLNELYESITLKSLELDKLSNKNVDIIF